MKFVGVYPGDRRRSVSFHIIIMLRNEQPGNRNLFPARDWVVFLTKEPRPVMGNTILLNSGHLLCLPWRWMCRVVKSATDFYLVRKLRKLTSVFVLIYIFYGMVPNLAQGQIWSVFVFMFAMWSSICTFTLTYIYLFMLIVHFASLSLAEIVQLLILYEAVNWKRLESIACIWNGMLLHISLGTTKKTNHRFSFIFAEIRTRSLRM